MLLSKMYTHTQKENFRSSFNVSLQNMINSLLKPSSFIIPYNLYSESFMILGTSTYYNLLKNLLHDTFVCALTCLIFKIPQDSEIKILN